MKFCGIPELLSAPDGTPFVKQPQPYPEAAKVAARNACGETKAGASRLTAFAEVVPSLVEL
jgi:hypothetical protein